MQLINSPEIEGFEVIDNHEVLGTNYLTLQGVGGTTLEFSEYGLARMRHDEDFFEFVERTAQLVNEGEKVGLETLEPCDVLQKCQRFHGYDTFPVIREASVYIPHTADYTVVKAYDLTPPHHYPLQYYAGNWVHRKLARASQDLLYAPAHYALLRSRSGHTSVISEFVDDPLVSDVLGEQFEDPELGVQLANRFARGIWKNLRSPLGCVGMFLVNDLSNAGNRNILVSGEGPIDVENVEERVFTIIDQPHPTLRAGALFKAMKKAANRKQSTKIVIPQMWN